MAVLAQEEKRIAERLMRLRETHALTQEAAAARAGVTLRQWQRWESGDSEPYARNVAKISDEFGIPLAELVGGAPEPEPNQLDRIEKALVELLGRIERLEMSPPSEPAKVLEPPTAEELLDELKAATRTAEALLGRLGRDVGRRGLQSRRAGDRRRESPSTAA